MKPYESKKSQFTRNLIRRRHAEWSEQTFGNVGPIGPLKHLSKEALEAAADLATSANGLICSSCYGTHSGAPVSPMSKSPRRWKKS